MKSVRICSYSGPHFPAFGLNTDQNNSVYGHFLRSVFCGFSYKKSRTGIEILWIKCSNIAKFFDFNHRKLVSKVLFSFANLKHFLIFEFLKTYVRRAPPEALLEKLYLKISLFVSKKLVSIAHGWEL